MSDPRFKKGVWQGNGYQHRRRLALDAKLDSPLFHGWTRAGETEDGYGVFSLELSSDQVAKMRAMTPQERFDTGHEWVVCIGDQAWGLSGSVAWVTEQVKAIHPSSLIPHPSEEVSDEHPG